MHQPGQVDTEGTDCVLVIDDAPEVHRLLAFHLSREELKCISAYDGPEGLSVARSRLPAAIILDLDMPGMDGLSVLRALKADEGTQNVPVLILAREQNAERKVECFEAGASDFIGKPFEFAELRMRLRSLLRTHRLFRLLAQRAQVDGLTGLWNRAFFDSRWSEEFARNSRQGHPLSLAMLDIDHFKRINDTHGHATGDVVLVGIAKMLSREGRRTDLVCRYGGEEFAIIMPDTPPGEAMNVCERIRAAICATTWEFRKTPPVTASVGVAGCRAKASVNAETWVQMADANLYVAKRGGRNRVVLGEVPPVDGSFRIAG
ncbi:MAG: diguanylate cyclase [Tepidisphaera sp.]|nr:diguanylate cyclase [Tepidisphaera sp.]